MEARQAFHDIRSQLNAIPVKNTKVRVEEEQADVMVLSIEKKYRNIMWLMAKMFNLRSRHAYKIEGIGKDLYELLDGETNIGDLVGILRERYELSFFESRGLVMEYLRMLTGKGLIVIAAPKEEAAGE